MRKKIKLHIRDQRDICNGNIKQPYYLFLEIGEKQFVFSNKVKAKKWLVSFENKLNQLTQELIHYAPKLYSYNVQLSLYMNFSEQKNLRNNLDYAIERYWKLYNSEHITSIGKEVNNIYNEFFYQINYYHKILGKSSRNQTLLKESKIDVKHLQYLGNDINTLFDVDKTLIAITNQIDKKKSIGSENYLRIA